MLSRWNLTQNRCLPSGELGDAVRGERVAAAGVVRGHVSFLNLPSIFSWKTTNLCKGRSPIDQRGEELRRPSVILSATARTRRFKRPSVVLTMLARRAAAVGRHGNQPSRPAGQIDQHIAPNHSSDGRGEVDYYVAVGTCLSESAEDGSSSPLSSPSGIERDGDPCKKVKLQGREKGSWPRT